MAYSRQKLGALFDLSLDPIPHRQKFLRYSSDLRGASNNKRGVGVATTEAFSCSGDGAKRKDLLPQEIDSQHKCENRAHNHQRDKDIGRGTRDMLDGRDDGQDT